MSKLNNLHLQRNELRGLGPGCFEQNTELSLLDIAHNDLKKIPKHIFNENTAVYKNISIRLNGNDELYCDKDLCWLLEARNKWITIETADDTFCAGPVELEGKAFDSLTEEDLRCNGRSTLISFY